jgi:ligand-binding sensor domain-containing protein/serine phosphatase RsbU (regulator of sigma subunit)
MSVVKAIISRAKFLAWLVLFLSLVSVQAGAQKYFFDNYSIKQGLSEQKVYTLLQDSKDYIWLGTANGVSRFDGKKFENFSTHDSLAPGGVRSIMEDSNGNIWFGHLNGGISRFNGNHFEKAAFDSLQLTGDITGIAQSAGKLWFTSSSDGAVLADYPAGNIKKLKAKQFRGKDGLSDQIFGLSLLNDSSLVYIADAGLRRYNNDDKKFEIYRMPHMTTYFSTICLLEDSRGNIWFGTYNGGIYEYVMSESRMEFIDLPKAGISSNWVSCLTEDSQGRMWVGTWGGGIAVIDKGRIQKMNQENGLKAAFIYDIIQDVEGNILIADQNNGLTIYKGDAFSTFNDENLPDPNINAIYQDKKGNMWFGTNAGIAVCPGNDSKILIHNNIKNELFESIRFFREDRNGNLWVGSNEGGVIMYDMKTSRFESQPYINSTLPNVKQVTGMEIDRDNNLWIGTAEGVVVGTINKENFVRYTTMDSLTVFGITALYNDPDGNMWIGIEPKGEKPSLIMYNAEKKDFRLVRSFSGLRPTSMVMDRSHILWIGTNEGLKALKNDSVTVSITENDGLLSNIINFVSAGDDGSIYIGTNNGLNRLFPGTNRIFSYTRANGFTGIESRPNAVFKSSSGNFWFGTANGAIRLDPGKTYTGEQEPLTHILGMRVNYVTREMKPGMKLKANERTIIFDYYSICLTNPDVVRYRVMLEGADKDWQPVTDQTRAIYSALPHGKYTFKVMARNSQGVWNSTPVEFSFIIRPPFYLTWWFILGSAVIAVLIIFIYVRERERKLIREKIILEEKVKERTAEVVQKSMEIEEKNRDITASIRYAERIQRAMLPRENTFSETFVLFMPKDIVSGDFYWMYDNGDQQFLAVCDCTGHGVPGAFMSIIGHNSLHKVVREYGITRPSSILDHLNTEVLKALTHRHEAIINDGMDMALIAFDKKGFTLEFAGAYNPLYVVRNGEVTVYKGDRFPIGMNAISDKKSFTNQVVDIRPGDMLYMCSDGYADQFGSADVKKYKSGNVKKLLSEVWSLPVCEQRDRLKNEILQWKGDLQQVDDILFVGTKIPQN